MSGHSKWSTIKHKKGAKDAARGKIFSKLNKEITVAAKAGGGNPDSNPRLRLAIATARSQNMPMDNIDRAIKKGTGELEGVSYEEISYEGYGPGGIAVYVQCLTDNKNRTSAEIRNIFSKLNGNMAGAGSVAWIFEAKGLITVTASAIDEEKLFEIISDAGAEDLSAEGNIYEIVCETANFESVKKALESEGVKMESETITMIPKNQTEVDAATASSVLALVDTLEDNDDVQNVYTNMDVSEDVFKELNG